MSKMAPSQPVLARARTRFDQGRLAEAERLCRQIMSREPDHAGALHLLARIALASGHSDTALALARQAALLAPGEATIQSEPGLMLHRLGRRTEALASLEHARDHLTGEARFTLGQLYYLEGRHAEAETVFRKLLDEQGGRAGCWGALGIVLHAQGQHEEAIACLRQAVTLAPERVAGYHNLAEALRQTGALDEAIAAYRAGLAQHPEDTALWHGLALTRRFASLDDADIQAMERLSKRPGLDRLARRRLAFALTKAYDDCGDPGRAGPELVRANRLKFEDLGRPDCSADLALFERIAETFTASFFARHDATGREDSIVPVFVVGMPRSGTTLVEQMLASHDAVFGCGETHALRQSLVDHGLGGNDWLARIERMSAAETDILAQDYLERLTSLGQGQRWLVNKLPFNFHLLGAIRLLFPHARVIHCRRNPIATCLSILQRDLPAMPGFMSDQGELGRYYRAYTTLMAHWRSVLPGWFHEIDYEALVTEPAREIAGMLEFCGLSWQAACLDFTTTRRTITTGSFAQVREGLHRRSLDRWQGYRPFLGPLLTALETNTP